MCKQCQNQCQHHDTKQHIKHLIQKLQQKQAACVNEFGYIISSMRYEYQTLQHQINDLKIILGGEK